MSRGARVFIIFIVLLCVFKIARQQDEIKELKARVTSAEISESVMFQQYELANRNCIQRIAE